MQEKTRILFIGDNSEIPDRMEKIIQRSELTDFRVISVKNESESIECLNQKELDLILIESDLLDNNRSDPLALLKERVPNIPVIILANEKDEKDAIDALDHGAKDYFIKEYIDIDVVKILNEKLFQGDKGRNWFPVTTPLYRKIVQNNPDAIFVINHNNVIVYLNPAVETLFRKNSEHLIGKPFGYTISNDRVCEIEILQPLGKTIIGEVKCICTCWRGKSARILTIRDITDRKRIEESLKHSAQDLSRSVTELKTTNRKFKEQQQTLDAADRQSVMSAGSLSSTGDLSTSLAQLLNNIELIKSSTESAGPLEDRLNKIETAGIKLAEVIKDLQSVGTGKEPVPGDDSRPENTTRQLNILAVEDSDFDFMAINVLLQDNKKIKLSRATSLAEGFKRIEETKYDLILLDYFLPDGNGLDFIKKMERNQIEIPVVVITGEGDEMVASQVIQEGAYNYLPKSRLSEKSITQSILNSLERFRLKKDIELTMKTMAEMSTRDGLTGLYNRRYLRDILNREVERGKRYHTDLVLCMVDLDNFKQINDSLGHLAGDMVLKKISSILKGNFRQSDWLCRYGGDEFALILPNIPTQMAFVACERLKKKVSSEIVKYNNSNVQVTLSIGIAHLEDDPSLSANGLISLADEALFKAKEKGRNQVIIYSRND